MALLACTASAQTIGTPEEREAFLERVGDLGAVTPEQALEHYADATDPFHPDEPVAAVATDAEDTGEADVSAGPSDREVLEALVERVRPTGVMTVGGERVVLFGERRIRAGDVLRFNYEGEPHQVTVGAIGARSFTLQLGDEEILKPVQ